MADNRRKIRLAAGRVLHPGEAVLAAVRAVAEGSPLGALGGLLVVLVLSHEQRSQAEAHGFPTSRSMVLAVTDRRLLVFRNSVFRRRRVLRGEVPFESLRRVTVERQGLNLGLRFVMSTRAQISFTTYRLDQPREFALILNEALERRARLAPVATPADPMPAPPLPPPPPS